MNAMCFSEMKCTLFRCRVAGIGITLNFLAESLVGVGCRGRGEGRRRTRRMRQKEGINLDFVLKTPLPYPDIVLIGGHFYRDFVFGSRLFLRKSALRHSNAELRQTTVRRVRIAPRQCAASLERGRPCSSISELF